MRPLLLICFFIPLLTADAPAQIVVPSWLAPWPAPWSPNQPKAPRVLDIGTTISWYRDMPLMGAAHHGVERADAIGLGYLIGLSQEAWFGESWGLRLGVRYLHQHASVSLERTIVVAVDPDPSDTIIPAAAPTPVIIEAWADFDLLETAFVYMHRVTGLLDRESSYGNPGFSLFLGPSFSYVLGADRSETMELAPGIQGRFVNMAGLPSENELGRLVIQRDDAVDHAGTRFGIAGGLQLEARLSQRWSLAASAECDFPLGGNTEGRIASLLAYVSLIGYF